VVGTDKEIDMDLDAMLQAFGREVAAERKRLGITQKQLAALARQYDDVSDRQIEKIEKGERGQFREVLAVAAALNIPFTQLAAEAEKRSQSRSA
jgi:transcriptional regulator with XRE-family HTH domain